MNYTLSIFVIWEAPFILWYFPDDYILASIFFLHEIHFWFTNLILIESYFRFWSLSPSRTPQNLPMVSRVHGH